MFEYGNLRFVKDIGWKFIVEGEVLDLGEGKFIKIFNELGIDGWELVLSEEQVGYIFKRKVE